MSFKLIYEGEEEVREVPNENYKIEDLLKELLLSTNSVIIKQNNELANDDNIINHGDEIKLTQIIYGG